MRSSAQRPKASERREHADGARRTDGLSVLNARRHRSGENGRLVDSGRQRGEVLNARRHRSGENSWCAGTRRTWRSSAQRPKASERREQVEKSNGVLFASPCSTPEGIGAARTGQNVSGVASDGNSAQRPKASERREQVRICCHR